MARVHLRRLMVAAAAAGIVAGAAVAPAAGTAAVAGVAPKDRVYLRNLPTHAEAASLYAGLRGGTREAFINPYISIRTEDCLAWTSGPTARHGRWAYYTGKDGTSPYVKGLPDPVVFVYKFATVRAAKGAYRVTRESIVGCYAVVSDDDTTIEAHGITVPPLGDARLGYREHETVSGKEHEDRFLTIWVREGRYLVETRIQQQDVAPAKRPAVRFTNVTLRRVP